MIVDVIMPKMGESLQEGTIIKWLKKEGESIERDEMILEISTDKVDTEVPAPTQGILKKILFGENETIGVGTKIAEIETDMAQASQPAAEAQKVQAPEPVMAAMQAAPAAASKPVVATPSTAALVDVIMPKMGESLQEGTIIKWLKGVGDQVDRDEMMLEISTDKVDTEVPSPVSGTIAEILAKENETVEVGKVIARIATAGAPVAAEPVPATTQTQAPATTVAAPLAVKGGTMAIPARVGEKFFSPLVRTIATDNAVSLEELMQLEGSGVDGRVTKDDILSYINTGRKIASATEPSAMQPFPQKKAESPAQMPPAAVKPQPAPASTGPDDEIIPMDRVRQLIAEHMTYSKRTSAHVTSVAEADVTRIVKLRDKVKDEFFKREGFKLTFTPFFAQAAVAALQEFPLINVSVDGKNIIRHKRINLGIATALNDGNLIVPVIKNAESLNITGLARSVYDLAGRARTKKLNPDDIQGGTFTITNLGTAGTLFGTPVINQPQTAIMGLGAIQKRPVVRELDGEDVIVVRSMVYVSLTYDHRVIDGMLAGKCLAAIVRSLESMDENTLKI